MNKISINSFSENNQIIKQAIITYTNGTEQKFYFKFPKSSAQDLTNRADPFIYTLIFPMMRYGGTFNIIGAPASKSVIDGITMFCRIWNIWCPETYKPIKIIANEIPDDYRPDNKNMVTAFSGGLDAAYTTYKYKKDLDPRFHFNIDKSIMILGADIPIKEKEQFQIAFTNAKKMTEDLNIELVPVEINYREYTHNWSYEFGAVLVGVLNFFSKNHTCSAASDSYLPNFPYPWGMNPITDRYLSNCTFKFISDGIEHSRTARANIIKNWQVGLENLRVCWRNNDKSKNCGHCEKCIRTKMNFMAVGIAHLPSMPNDLSNTQISLKHINTYLHSKKF